MRWMLVCCLFARVAAADKLVVVTTASWSATTGELRRYERSKDGRWQSVGAAIPVVVGKGGLAWPDDKREGDGKTPAGKLRLSSTTGYDATPPKGTRLPYRQATAALRCVDDPKSMAYNTLADAPGDWSSAELMRRADALYRLVVVVDHNATRTPGKGSCIFLHVWRGSSSPTVGCIAMAYQALADLFPWLEGDTQLVALPKDVYDEKAKAWDLPTSLPI